jgi:hypothetical protein
MSPRKKVALGTHGKIPFIVLIAAVVVVVVLLIARDFLLRGHTISCDDGMRRAIDQREFTTDTWAYSVELEASVTNKGKASAKLSPVQLQQLSASVQSANEFRKGVVAGYNGCAITKEQYAQYLTKSHALDSLAREINELVSKPSLSQDESTKLGDLLRRYGELIASLGGG